LYAQKEFTGPYCYEKYMGRIKMKTAPVDVLQKELVPNDGNRV